MLEVTDSAISYHRPLTSRIGAGFLGMCVGVMCLYLLYSFWPSLSVLANRSPADVLKLVFRLILPLAALCLPTAFLLYRAGPLDLIINTSQRTYRFRRGFPLLASWQTGLLDDIVSLRVKTHKKNVYLLLLDWRNRQAGAWTLGDGAVSSRRPVEIMFPQEAFLVREKTQQLAVRLGVPIKETEPIWDKMREHAISYLVLVPLILSFLLMGLLPLLVAHSLQAGGQAMTGTVTAVEDGKEIWVQYRYHAGPRVFDGSAEVMTSGYRTLQAGDPVSVHYLPAYPHTSTIVGSRDTEDSPRMLAGAFLAMALLLTRLLTKR